MNEKTIDVSVAMMTYYHEKYVSRAIESVLNQETDYSYEIVISDDGSQDETRNILKEYEKKYPNIICVIYNENNKGISLNNYSTRLQCRGRYIATLSGDDYWIDNKKLQKQVEFLDSHPDIYATVTSVEGRFEEDEIPFEVYPPKNLRGKYISLEMFLHGAMVGTHGMMMRNAFLTAEGREYFSLVPKASPYIDDTTEVILILLKSPIYSMDINGVAYRVRRSKKTDRNYNSTTTPYEKCKRIIDLYNNLYNHFEGEIDFSYIYRAKVALLILCLLSSGNIKQFKKIYLSIPKEYRKKHIIICSIPKVIKKSFGIIFNKTKKRARK